MEQDSGSGEAEAGNMSMSMRRMRSRKFPILEALQIKLGKAMASLKRSEA